MRRLLLGLLFAVASTAALAVSTTSVTLTTSWQDLGVGPLQIQTNNQSQTLYQIADTIPSSTAGGFFLQGNATPQTVATTSHVYVRARAIPTKGAAPVVLYAPVSSAGGGGGGGGGGAITAPLGNNTKANSVSTTFATDFLGQTTMTGSLPVAIASNQSAIPVTGTFFQATQPVSQNGTWTVAQGAPASNANAWPHVLVQGGSLLSNSNPLPVLPFDVRGTGTLTATAGQVLNIPLNGTASAGITVTGLTASGATLSFNTSNDGGATYLTKGAINCSGINPTTLAVDGQTRFDLSGATNLQIKVLSSGTGTISVAYNLSSAPVACPNVVAPPPTYQLLSNASASGSAFTVNGGNYLLALSGTFNGATVTINATVNGVTTALGSYTAAPATPPSFLIASGTSVQAVVSGGTPSALYATLGGTGAPPSNNPSLGQATMAASSPVVIASDQSAVSTQYATSANRVSGTLATAMTGTTSTQVLGAPGTGLRNYITSIIISNSSATVGTEVALQDGSGGTTLMTIPAAASYGGATIALPSPLAQPTLNTGLYAVDLTTGAAVKVTVVGYKGP